MTLYWAYQCIFWLFFYFTLSRDLPKHHVTLWFNIESSKANPMLLDFSTVKLSCPVIGHCYVLLSFSVCTTLHSTCFALHESQLSTQGQIAGKDFTPICLEHWERPLIKCSPIHLDSLTLNLLYCTMVSWLSCTILCKYDFPKFAGACSHFSINRHCSCEAVK